MTDFLAALKADLLDRRLLPVLALLGAALLAALAYAALGGGSTNATPVALPAGAPLSPGASGIAVSEAPRDASQSVAETTSGSSHQRGGYSRNPFTPLPGATLTSSAAVAGAATTTTSSKAGSGSSSSSKSTGGTAPTSPAKSPAPKKSQTVYTVAVRFGAVPAGTPPQSVQLTPFASLTRKQPLPSAAQPLVVFRGVIAGGKSATFTLVGEAILRGKAVCVPSASQCQAIDLKPGQTEELEYLPPSGAAITYQLQLVSINRSLATDASARRAFRSESKAGRELLRRIGLAAIPGLRYSTTKGVLMAVGHPAAFAALSHAAARRRP